MLAAELAARRKSNIYLIKEGLKVARIYPTVKFSEASPENMVRFRIRAYRQARNITQRMLSDTIGIANFVTRFETPSDKGFSYTTLITYTNALGLQGKADYWAEGQMGCIMDDMKTASYFPRLKFLMDLGQTINDADAQRAMLAEGL